MLSAKRKTPKIISKVMIRSKAGAPKFRFIYTLCGERRKVKAICLSLTPALSPSMS